jgi:hypothetical protein
LGFGCIFGKVFKFNIFPLYYWRIQWEKNSKHYIL